VRILLLHDDQRDDDGDDDDDDDDNDEDMASLVESHRWKLHPYCIAFFTI